MTRSSTILATLLALTVAMPARAQAASRPVQPPAVGRPTDPAVASIAADVRAGLVEMARADRDLLPSDGESTLRPAEDEALDRRARARVRVATGLESLLAAGAPGRAAIRTLATDWPDADLVRRAEIRAAFRAGDAADALASTTRMAVSAPRDTQLLGWRADALESLGRAGEALRARQARYELAPDDAEGWRALLAAHAAAGTLPRLRESLARMRLLYPTSRAVREHEIELLRRLGRADEAARLTADTTGVRP